jgi:hypothetical protein
VKGEATAELRRPATLGQLGDRVRSVHVATVLDEMPASAERVFRVLKGVAEGHGGNFEWAEVLARSGNRLLCDFWTEIPLPLGHRYLFPTRETVELDPPLRLHYRHRSGPSRGLAETMTIRPLDASRSRVIYVAAYPSRRRWWGQLFAIFAKPVAHLFMRIHFWELRRAVGPTDGQALARSRSIPSRITSSPTSAPADGDDLDRR